jgi:UDP-glucose 4-epimerase
VRILVTGGAGFIGSHVVDAYVDAGHEVIVADDLSSGSRRNLNMGARFHEIDVRSDDLDALVRTVQPELINHHAAQISVRRSMDEPLYDASVNILGSLTVLEAARRHGVRRVVFASTGGAIYGEVDAGVADETHPCRPMSAYAISKLATEHYLEAYRLNHGLETIVLRYANVFGPRQDPHGEAGVVAIFIRKILGALTPVIFGDGEQTRDFVYVGDVVRANLAAVDARPDDARPPVFNIATGRELSVNALWTALARIAGGQLEPLYEPPRPGDLRRSVLDPGRARRELGWSVTVPVLEGLRSTWEWFAAVERAPAAA